VVKTKSTAMFMKAFTKLSKKQWMHTPKTTNPVESINRQSVNESSLCPLVKKIYTEDRVHAAKLAAIQCNFMSISILDEGHTERNKKESKIGSDPACLFYVSVPLIYEQLTFD